MTDAVRCAAAAADQHRVAHARGPRRGPGDHATVFEDFPHLLLDRGVADLTADAELVAAREEDAGGTVEGAQLVTIERFAAIVDIQLDHLSHAQLAEDALVFVEIGAGVLRGDRRDHQLAAVQPTGHLAQNDLLTPLVLATPDDDQGAFSHSLPRILPAIPGPGRHLQPIR